MNGWMLAVLALGTVLGFEYVLFRYVGTERSGRGRVDGPSRSPDASGSRTAAADAPSTSGARARDDHRRASADTVVSCRRCGARNADEPTVVFCRSCLERLP